MFRNLFTIDYDSVVEKSNSFKVSELILIKETHAEKDAYIIGCNGACGVTGYELKLHVDFSEQVLVSGSKSRARGLV